METSLPHIEPKEPSDYQKLKGLAIKLKKELDVSRIKILALENDLKISKDSKATNKSLNENDKISLAQIFLSCSHKDDIDLKNTNVNGIDNAYPKEYCSGCIDKAQECVNAYAASAEDNSKLTGDNEALAQANRHLQEENERLNGQVVRLHREMGTIEDNKELLRVKDLEIEGFEKSLSNLKLELQNKDNCFQVLQKESQETDKKIAELDICIAKLNEEKESLIARETNQKEQIDELEAELLDSKHMVTTLVEEKENVTHRLEEVQVKLQQTLNDSERDYKLFGDKIDALTKFNRELEEKLDLTKDKLAVENLNNQKLAQELNKCCLEHEKYKARVHQILNKQTEKCDVLVQTMVSPQKSKDIEKCRSCDELKNTMEKVDSKYAALRERFSILEKEKKEFISKETLVKKDISNNLYSFDTRTSRLLKNVEKHQIDCQLKFDTLQKKLHHFVASLENKTAVSIPSPTSPSTADATTLVNGPKGLDHSPSSTDLPSQTDRGKKCHFNKERADRKKDRTGRRKRSLDLLIDDWLQKSSNLDLPARDPKPVWVDPSSLPDAAEARVAHLQELLGENEGQVRRLSEQVDVLKREIRRLDQAQTCKDNVKHIEMDGETKESLEQLVYRHNLEYLKNVFYKFLGPEIDVKQRKSLVPVINTLLALTPPQQQTLKQMAECRDALPKPVHRLESFEPAQGTRSSYTLGNILPSSITSYLQR